MRWSSSCFVPPNKFPVFRFSGLETFPNPYGYTLQHSTRNCKCYLSRKTAFHVFTTIRSLFCAVRRKIICISSYREIGNDSNSVDSCRGQADRFAFPEKSPRRRFRDRHREQNFQAACKIYPKSSPLPCLAGAERNIWIFLIFFTCTFGRTVIGRYRSQDPEGIPQNGGRLPPGRQEITNGHIRGVIYLHFGHHFRYHAGHCDFLPRTGWR